MDSSYQPIYRRLKGNTFSEGFSIFYNGEKYKLVFQKFKRDQVSKSDKKKGIKPKRKLLMESNFFFTTLENIEFSQLPCKTLSKEFCEKFNIIWK
ncbi:hypothetical protein [Xenorhabdus ishibashii]|uniref:Uncharacterized protein n=1 Tax=Xenorhabdus ishibashii TaxID=1034471 RepID=A0A2D0K7V2_9GAMM|nr:hypothetical protein [Xenorhabdus ishibashii]PHM59526.1 hypothetical protein Xish_03645 [Xenorhabdus ishibashii]